MSERVHVLPIADMAEHVLAETCWCVPVVKPEIGGVVICHNALDGRESQDSTQRKAS